jgi:5-methylcytosine-specific restriction enzyme A
MVKLANPGRRSTEEWIGKTPDSKPPRLVALRVFERHGGICHISGRKIMPGELWDTEHVIRINDGGENRESNLRPALRDKHREKTARENSEAAPITARRASHVGLRTAPKRKIKSAPMPVSEKTAARQSRPRKAPLPWRPMFH